jgi:hypothetical protein
VANEQERERERERRETIFSCKRLRSQRTCDVGAITNGVSYFTVKQQRTRASRQRRPMSSLPNLSALRLGKTDANLRWDASTSRPAIRVSFHVAVINRLHVRHVALLKSWSVTMPRHTRNQASAEGDSSIDYGPSFLDLLSPELRAALARAEAQPVAGASVPGAPAAAAKKRRVDADDSSGPSTDDPSGPSTDDQKLFDEYMAVCQWLRMTRVLSDPSGTVLVSPLASDELNQRIFNTQRSVTADANTALKNIAAKQNVQTRWQIALPQIVRHAELLNERPVYYLDVPHFKSFNKSEQTKPAEAYMAWLKEASVDVAYSDALLARASETQVDHVVPKSWLRQTSVILELSTPENDPVNVQHTLREYNQSKRDMAVYLKGTTMLNDYNLHEMWAPAGFTVKHQAVVARIVAYMFLTYPMITSEINTVLRRAGAPKYEGRYSTIITLCAEEPNHHELLTAYVIYGRWGLVNPLVVSRKARQALADKSSKLSQLLRARLGGADECSKAVFDAMKDSGVAFFDGG